MKRTLAIIVAAAVSACSSSNDGPPPGPGPGAYGEPNGTPATATPFTIGTPVVAEISQGTDYDNYRLTIPAGGATVRIQTFDSTGANCDPINGTVDTYLQVLDANENRLLSCPSYPSPCDDSGPVFCEDVTVTLAAGTAYVQVSGYPPYPFTYALKVTQL